MASTAAPGSSTTAPKSGNAFTRKIGPLPMYGWLAIVGGGVLIWAYIANRNASSSTASQSGTANSSEVPDFINQTYTTVTPPSAPSPTPDHDTTHKASGPPPVSRVHRSKAVQHKIHQIHQIHEKNADKGKKKVTAKKPTGRDGGPARRTPAHPARKK